MDKPIILWQTKPEVSTDDAGTTITSVVLPPPALYDPGPYEKSTLEPTAHLRYVPSLAYFCIRKLIEYADQCDFGLWSLRYERPASSLSYDILRALIPSYLPATDATSHDDIRMSEVDPRLWAVILQVFTEVPDVMRVYPIALSDRHLPLLQRIPSTSNYSLLTALQLPGCTHLTDDTIIQLKALNGLCAFDASETRLTAQGISRLAGTMSWSLEGKQNQRRGPWQLRILRLRKCTRIGDEISRCISKFPLLSVVDLRGTRCSCRVLQTLGAFRLATNNALFHPASLLDSLSELSSCPSLFSSTNPFVLHVDRRDYSISPQGRRLHNSIPLSNRPRPAVAPEDTYVVLSTSEGSTTSRSGKRARVAIGNSEALARNINRHEKEMQHAFNSAAWKERHERQQEESMAWHNIDDPPDLSRMDVDSYEARSKRHRENARPTRNPSLSDNRRNHLSTRHLPTVASRSNTQTSQVYSRHELQGISLARSSTSSQPASGHRSSLGSHLDNAASTSRVQPPRPQLSRSNLDAQPSPPPPPPARHAASTLDLLPQINQVSAAPTGSLHLPDVTAGLENNPAPSAAIPALTSRPHWTLDYATSEQGQRHIQRAAPSGAQLRLLSDADAQMNDLVNSVATEESNSIVAHRSALAFYTPPLVRQVDDVSRRIASRDILRQDRARAPRDETLENPLKLFRDPPPWSLMHEPPPQVSNVTRTTDEPAVTNRSSAHAKRNIQNVNAMLAKRIKAIHWQADGFHDKTRSPAAPVRFAGSKNPFLQQRFGGPGNEPSTSISNSDHTDGDEAPPKNILKLPPPDQLKPLKPISTLPVPLLPPSPKNSDKGSQHSRPVGEVGAKFLRARRASNRHASRPLRKQPSLTGRKGTTQSKVSEKHEKELRSFESMPKSIGSTISQKAGSTGDSLIERRGGFDWKAWGTTKKM